MEVIQSIVALIVIISILVTIHEWGHFIVARFFNVKVLRFSVGFGKPLYSYQGKPYKYAPPPEDQEIRTRSNEEDQGTEFVIAAIPLGGYVKMLDEREGYVPDDQLHLAFNRKPVLQRIAIVLAGPLANFLLAILVYWFLFAVGVTGLVPVLGKLDAESKAATAGLMQGQEIVAIDGKPVATWSQMNLALFNWIGETGEIQVDVLRPGESSTSRHRIEVSNWLQDVETPKPAQDLGLVLNTPATPIIIDSLLAGKRGQKAGLKAGDQVLSVDGVSVENWGDWVQIIQDSPERTLSFEVLRQGETLVLEVIPEKVDRDGKTIGFIGASPVPAKWPEDMLRQTRYPIYSAWIPAVDRTWSVTKTILVSIKKMLEGAISPRNLSGPITIAQLANDAAKSGFESFIGLLALLSISLGVLNLLPIPILDGGHLLYYLFEVVLGRPLPEKVQIWGLQIGMFLIVGIMLLAFYNDLV